MLICSRALASHYTTLTSRLQCSCAAVTLIVIPEQDQNSFASLASIFLINSLQSLGVWTELTEQDQNYFASLASIFLINSLQSLGVWTELNSVRIELHK